MLPSQPPRRRVTCLMAAAAESRGLAHHAPRSLRLRARSPPPDTLRAARCVASAAAAGNHGVREATPADLDGLADVEVACGNYEWGRDAIKHELKSALATVLLAEAPSLDTTAAADAPGTSPPPPPATPGAPSVRGLAIVWTVADEAQLLEVAVHPAWRRRGVGAALVAAVLARAPAGGSVVLEVAQSNDAARALYASYGFEETGRRKGYYRDGGDAVLMARRVGE